MESESFDETNAERIVAKLNNLLANYSLFYQNARGFRWHITGGKSEDLKEKFNELYSNLQKEIDKIADRIIALGHRPDNIFSEYISLSLIPESKKIWEEEEAIANIIESYSTLINLQKKISEKATELGDEETRELMNDFIYGQEIKIEMYFSYLKTNFDSN